MLEWVLLTTFQELDGGCVDTAGKRTDILSMIGIYQSEFNFGVQEAEKNLHQNYHSDKFARTALTIRFTCIYRKELSFGSTVISCTTELYFGISNCYSSLSRFYFLIGNKKKS